MKLDIIFSVLGRLILLLGAMMFMPLGVALYYGESPYPFSLSIIFTISAGVLLSLRYLPSDDEWELREGFVIVAFGWLFIVLFGSLPFLYEGVSSLNAFFESMSGFTTTGATVLVDIESHSKSLLFWRSMTQWFGGMGIIMLFIAILPKLGIAGRQMFRAEAPGPRKISSSPV